MKLYQEEIHEMDGPGALLSDNKERKREREGERERERERQSKVDAGAWKEEDKARLEPLASL